MVAAEVAQFDHMSRGRFMLGIGPGGLLSDFELFGNADRGVRARKTMESIALIQRIWAQDPPYDFPGEFRSVTLKEAIIPGLGIGTMPKPFQKSGPPVTMSVSSRNSPTARVAGQQGWGILSGNNMPANAVATHWQSYGKACADAGRTAQARTGGWRAISWWRRATPRLATASFPRWDRTITFTPICARCCPASASCRS